MNPVVTRPLSSAIRRSSIPAAISALTWARTGVASISATRPRTGSGTASQVVSQAEVSRE